MSGHVATRHVLVAVVFVLIFLASAVLLSERASRSTSVSVDLHGRTLPEARQVQLSLEMPSPSNSDGLHAKLVSGTMPTAPLQATVLSDQECQPDARGVSRCLNRLRLPDGSEIHVRHPHEMAKIPCLTPGEQVWLVPML
jgi:hypothetical protein